MTGEWSTIETVLSEPHAQLQRRVLSDWAFRREGGNSSDLTNNAQETTNPQSIWKGSTLKIEEEDSRHVLNNALDRDAYKTFPQGLLRTRAF